MLTVFTGHYWQDLNNQKQFFVDFAKEKKFDPLIPHNWYQVSKNDLLHSKGIGSILPYYKGRISLALLQVFNDIGLDEEKLKLLL